MLANSNFWIGVLVGVILYWGFVRFAARRAAGGQ